MADPVMRQDAHRRLAVVGIAQKRDRQKRRVVQATNEYQFGFIESRRRALNQIFIWRDGFADKRIVGELGRFHVTRIGWMLDRNSRFILLSSDLSQRVVCTEGIEQHHRNAYGDSAEKRSRSVGRCVQ